MFLTLVHDVVSHIFSVSRSFTHRHNCLFQLGVTKHKESIAPSDEGQHLSEMGDIRNGKYLFNHCRFV